MSVTIEQLGPEETALVANRIAEAFTALEVTYWLVPDPSKREAVLAGDFEILVGHAMRHGMVYATADRASVAVWFPSVGEPSPPPADYDARLAAACGEWTDRFQHLDELFAANHPHPDHHHLAFLATSRTGRVRGWAPLCCGSTTPGWTPTGCRRTSRRAARAAGTCMPSTATWPASRSGCPTGRRSGRCGGSRAVGDPPLTFGGAPFEGVSRTRDNAGAQEGRVRRTRPFRVNQILSTCRRAGRAAWSAPGSAAARRASARRRSGRRSATGSGCRRSAA